MSLADLDVKATYQGTGAQTTFAIPFAPIVDDSAETVVYIRDETDPNDITVILQVEGALNDYTLTGAPDANSFHVNVEFNTAPTANQKVIISRVLPLTQTLDQSTGSFQPVAQETAFDRLVAMIQQVNEKVERCLRATITEQLSDTAYELPEPVAGNVIGWNQAGTGITHYSPGAIAEAGANGITSTTDLPEGTNLYYTNARATAAADARYIEDHADVTGTAVADDILRHNGTTWTFVKPGVAKLDDLTAPDTLTSSHHVITVTGASGDINLPAISLATDRIYKVIHHGTTYTNQYTINPSGTETIGNNSTTSKVLRFYGEEIVFAKNPESTGPDWLVLSHTVPAIDAHIHVDTGNGYGSTATQVRRYTTIRSDTSAGLMTYADSSTNGGSITVNVAGIYSITVSDRYTASAHNVGITINGSAGSTPINTVTYAQGKRAINRGETSGRAGCSITIALAAGDVIRCHQDGVCNEATDNAIFRVVLVRPILG